MSIDWKRIAEPQEDGYDVALMLDHVHRIGPYAQRKWRALPDKAKPMWEGSRAHFIDIDDYARPSSEFGQFPPDHPNVQAGMKKLELWPAIMPLVREMIAFCPLTLNTGNAGHGCTCGNYGDDWGWLYVSADNVWGMAEGIVHEMNHWKLRALGVWFEEWTPLLLDHPFDELFISPVRKDKPRPMGAVLHAQYSYIAVAEMCNRMLAAEPTPNLDDVYWTELQIQRITEGQNTLRANAKGTTDVGDKFLEGVDEWTSRVISEGTAACTKVKQGLL